MSQSEDLRVYLLDVIQIIDQIYAHEKPMIVVSEKGKGDKAFIRRRHPLAEEGQAILSFAALPI